MYLNVINKRQHVKSTTEHVFKKNIQSVSILTDINFKICLKANLYFHFLLRRFVPLYFFRCMTFFQNKNGNLYITTFEKLQES